MPQAPPFAIAASASTISLRRLGIDTYQEPVLYMRRDCHVCRVGRIRGAVAGRGGAGRPQHRRDPERGQRRVPARPTRPACRKRPGDCSAHAGDDRHAAPPGAARVARPRARQGLRAPAHRRGAGRGDRATSPRAAIRTSNWRPSSPPAPAIGSTCDETIALTRAMVDVGERMHWSEGLVMDKHCVGGLPGNRTTMLDRADRRRLRAAHAQDLVARHHLAGRHGRHHGDAGAGGPGRAADPARGRAHRRLHRLGRRGSAEPGRRHADPRRAAAGPGQPGPAGRLDAVEEGGRRRDPCADRHAGRPDGQGAQRARGGTCWRASSSKWAARSGCRCAWRRPTAARRWAAASAPRSRRATCWRCCGASRRADRPARSARCSWPARCSSSAAPRRRDSGMALATAVLDDGRAWRKFQEICEAQGGMREPPRGRATRSRVLAPRSGSRGRHRQPAAGAHRQAGGRAQDPPAPASTCMCSVGEFVERGQPLYHAACRLARRAGLRGGVRGVAGRNRSRDRGCLMKGFHADLALPGGGPARGRPRAAALQCDWSELALHTLSRRRDAGAHRRAGARAAAWCWPAACTIRTTRPCPCSLPPTPRANSARPRWAWSRPTWPTCGRTGASIPAKRSPRAATRACCRRRSTSW